VLDEKSNIKVALATPIHPVNAIAPKSLVTILNISNPFVIIIFIVGFAVSKNHTS